MNTMEKSENAPEKNPVEIAYEISQIVDFVKNDILNNTGIKECKGLILLKEKCCSKNLVISSTAYNGITMLVEHKILVVPQTLSVLISLLPSTNHINPLVSAIGNILLFDLKDQLAKKKSNIKQHFNSKDIQNPFVIILKCNGSKSWFEIYSFMCHIIQQQKDIKWEHRMNLISPIFYYVFESLEWTDSPLQMKLMDCLISKTNDLQCLSFGLEILMWKKINLQYCIYIKDMCSQLLSIQSKESKLMLSALNPYLADCIKWIIQNGYNPSPWVTLLNETIQDDDASLSVVLFIITDVISETPPHYIVDLVEICKSIICSASCGKYVAAKFVAVALTWFTNPSSMAHPLFKPLEETLIFLEGNHNEWNDQTYKLFKNKYFNEVTGDKVYVKFSSHLISVCNYWESDMDTLKWLENLKESNELEILFKMNTFICGIALFENTKSIVNVCLELLSTLIEGQKEGSKEVSLTVLCLLFYKLTKETEPSMQRIYLSHIPKLAVNKENIPLITCTIESLKRGNRKVMNPLVVQLLLSLWKSESRTFKYLHQLLHENSLQGFDYHLNLSKAVALREICRVAPHLHAKDVIGVLSRVLNESVNDETGLISSIALEAIVDLCRAFVIDVIGTWNAIQPTLGLDKRPKVIIALCKFFEEIPKLSSSAKKNEKFIKNIVGLLWNYTFMDNIEVVKNAHRALAKFELENLNFDFLPEKYRIDIKEGIYDFIPPECWLKVLNDIHEEGENLLMAILERDLNSLPRGLFYLPPEKAEPLNYSYLPQRSLCRFLTSKVLKYSKMSPEEWPIFLKELIRLLSLDYGKLLPPINWQFMSSFMNSEPDLLLLTLALLIKQGSVSKSAKSVVEDYLTSVKWSEEMMNQIGYMYSKLPHLYKSVSNKIFLEFVSKTLNLCLKVSLEKSVDDLERILHYIKSEVFMNENITDELKTAVVKCIENIMALVPSDHKIIKSVASCVAEFPMKSIDNITRFNLSSENFRDHFLRAVLIRYAFAMRPAVRNPLSSFAYLIDEMGKASVPPDMKNILINYLIMTLRNRRNCDHSPWMFELMRKIRDCGPLRESNEVILYLLEIFISSVLVLSGFDSLFNDVTDFMVKEAEKSLEIFPLSYSAMVHSSKWIPIQSKMTQWMQQLVLHNYLPSHYKKAFTECILLSGHYEKNYYSHYRSLISVTKN